jgi:uncharacterized membrane protein YkvA (DUF1232 family)
MTFSAKQQFEFTNLPGFPRTLFSFKQYDGGKTIAAILLILASTYFLTGFLGFLIDHNSWLHDWIYPPQVGIDLPHNPWWNPSGWFHTGKAVVSATLSYVDLFFRLCIFLCAYCLAWGTFDPKNIEGYAMGLFNAFLGGTYVLSPTDLIPDVLPVVGTLDDTVLGVGMVILGMASWWKTRMRNEKTKTILDLVDHGNTERAFQLLLEDKGISVKAR